MITAANFIDFTSGSYDLPLTVNQKVHALLAKKGKPARSSSESEFTKALSRLVAGWQAESLKEHGRKNADFKDTYVADSRPRGLRLSFSSYATPSAVSGYDSLSASSDYPVESYRNALQALCDIHGWSFEDHSACTIYFYRN